VLLHESEYLLVVHTTETITPASSVTLHFPSWTLLKLWFHVILKQPTDGSAPEPQIGHVYPPHAPRAAERKKTLRVRVPAPVRIAVAKVSAVEAPVEAPVLKPEANVVQPSPIDEKEETVAQKNTCDNGSEASTRTTNSDTQTKDVCAETQPPSSGELKRPVGDPLGVLELPGVHVSEQKQRSSRPHREGEAADAPDSDDDNYCAVGVNYCNVLLGNPLKKPIKKVVIKVKKNQKVGN